MRKQIFCNYIHIIEPEGRAKKSILLEMPHSGLIGYNPEDSIPTPLASKINHKSENIRKAIGAGCDTCVPPMSGFHDLLMEFELCGISNDLSRIFCDTNRDPEQVSDWVKAGGNPYDHHHGVIWSSTPIFDADLSLSEDLLKELLINNAEKILKEPLAENEFNAVIEAVYNPYHAHIRRLHQKIINGYGFCIHVALHSIPPFTVRKINGAYIFGKKSKRGPLKKSSALPDIILIHNEYKAANKIIVDVLRHTFEKEGLIVADGQGPLKGDVGITAKYGDPLRSLNIVGIEHVAHDLEPKRHLGNPEVNLKRAQELKPIYRKAILALMEL